MPKDPELAAAEEALTAAIQALLAVVDGENAGKWSLGEYVLVTAQYAYDGEGDLLTSTGLFSRDGQVPLHRALGLVDNARTRLKSWLTEPADAD